MERAAKSTEQAAITQGRAPVPCACCREPVQCSGGAYALAVFGFVSSELSAEDFVRLDREQYVKNKKAIGRKKDLANLEAIGEA
jgi:hypothetical protein